MGLRARQDSAFIIQDSTPFEPPPLAKAGIGTGSILVETCGGERKGGEGWDSERQQGSGKDGQTDAHKRS